MSYPITPSVYRNDNILAVSTPTYCEEVSGNWRYVFGIMVKAGYSVEIESAIYVHNATTTEATIQDKGKSISGYYTYWADMPVSGDNQPDGITIFVNTPGVVATENYSLSALRGTGIRSVTFYRILDGSYIESDYAKVGEQVLFRIALESSASSMITPYASYTDAGGTVHQVSLSHQPESNEYMFTMPAGNVVVATNAEAGGSSGEGEYIFGTRLYDRNFYLISYDAFDSFNDVLWQVLADSFNVPTTFRTNIEANSSYISFVSDISQSNFYEVEYEHNRKRLWYHKGVSNVSPGYIATSQPSVSVSDFVVYGNNNWGISSTSTLSNSVTFYGGVYIYSGVLMMSNLLISLDEPIPSPSILVDYTLTPSTAGEIDGPETLESSADFSFTFTLNPGYQFKSCSALSVVRGVNNWNQLIPANTVVTSSGNVYTVAVSNLNEDLNGVNISINCINTNDPNDTPTTPTTTNTPQGGDGDHDPTSDVILPSAVPSLSAHDTGLITVFRPTLAQLQDLGNYLWTNITDFIENLQKWFSNPMDFIVALTVVPCIPDVGASRNVQIGLWETNISMPPVTSQWVTIDCGTIEVTNFYGSALDYSPYTKISAMLPFVGSVHLDTDEIMGKNVQLIYRIDIVSGHCVAMIVVDRSVLYQFSGECSANIPLTGADWSRVYGAIVNTAIGVATIAAAGTGMVAGAKAMDSAAKVDSTSRALDSLANVSTQMKGIAGVKEARELALQNVRNAQNIAGVGSGGAANAIRAQTLIHAVGNTVNSVMGAKVQAGHASSLTGNAGLIGTRKPYLLIEYPNQSLAEGYKHYMGYPSNVSGTIGSFSGYTVFEQVIPSINCTDDELEEILNALKGGVYL